MGGKQQPLLLLLPPLDRTVTLPRAAIAAEWGAADVGAAGGGG